MTFTFRPAKRENTPLVIGLAGPTKSGKTYSAHRLAAGLADGRPIAMINAEGAKGHQYTDHFTYLAADIEAPFRPERYTEALKTALALDPRPAVVIIDSLSHMHDGPGGILEYHEDELDRLAGNDQKARQRSTWSAWVKPKAAENAFIYEMLSSDCHLVLCFRAKEKLKLVRGKDPVELGWQPIGSERVAFETIFTLMLPPHSKGVPDLSLSDMREPFDRMIPEGQPLSEETGRKLAEWAAGGGKPPVFGQTERQALRERQKQHGLTDEQVRDVLEHETGKRSTQGVPAPLLGRLLEALDRAAATDTAGTDAQPEPEPEPEPGTEPEAEASGDAQELFPIPAGATKGGHQDHG